MGNEKSKPIDPDDEVKLNHFKLLRVVGKGAFGKVRIVERKDTGLTFALKYIRKDEIVRQENVRNIVRERKMLEHLNHPFLCNLRYSFQDHEFVYLVVDLMTGGDLRFHIERKTFTEDAVQFWMAELGCALKYCHSQGIVHRDVKPDNVLLDEEGHVHLADFNVAADFTDQRRPLTSKSGTLAYVAPEAMAGKTYRSEVDWWALGVMFYECIYNKRPFVRKKGQPDIEEQVIAANPKYPITEPRVSPACVSAMKALMTKERKQRIGAKSWESFTRHPFFANLDFKALERKEILPVFVPSSDKTNFDATYDLEELLLEEAPLEARARHQKPRAALKDDATAAERRVENLHKMIEQYFEPFDYTKASFEKLPGADRVSPTATSDADGATNTTSSSNKKSRGTTRNESKDRLRQRSQTPDHLLSHQNTATSEGSTSAGEPSNLNHITHRLRSNTSPSPGNSRSPSPLPSMPMNASAMAKQRTDEYVSAQPSPMKANHAAIEQIKLPQRPHPSPRSKSVAIGIKDDTPLGRTSLAIDRQSQPWADVTPKTAVASEGTPDYREKKSRGLTGFLRSRKAGSKANAKPQEAGIMGKVGARHIKAEDGG